MAVSSRSNPLKECDYYTEPPNVWQVYEMRKQEIILMNLSCRAYEQAIKNLLEELGL